MHRSIIPTLLIALAAGALASGGVVAADRVFPYETREETLDNGLKVIVVPMSSNGLVAYWSIVRTGSRDEFEPGRTGFAHFFEHMMFQGTERYSQDEYNKLMTRMGADANAYTTDDLTAYHVGVAAEDLDTVIAMESDRFRNLSYAKADFETEAGAVYGEYRKNRTSPVFTLFEALGQTAFTRHTYGHTTMGYEKDIKAMPGMFDYSRSFFSRYYRPENVVLLVAGDVDPDGTLAGIKKHYGDWERGYEAPRIPVEPEQKKERRVDVAYDGQTLPWLVAAYKIDRFDPANRPWVALSLLAELAFGETSAVHKKLVLDEQIVEFIGTDVGMNRDPGLMGIYSRVKKVADLDRVLAEIDAVIAHYRENLPDAGRLADLKSRLRYDFLMNLDTPDRVASRMARIIAITGGIDAVDALYGAYAAVEPEDIRAAAQHYLVRQRRTVATVKGKN